MINIKNTYPAQAIAIVMVILVVATVLGASLYSRTLKNREAAVNTKDSMQAIEQADTLLDLFVRADYQFLQDMYAKIQEGQYETFSDIASLRTFLQKYGINVGLLDQEVAWCEDTSKGSSIKLTISEAEPADFVDIRVGSARVFNIQESQVDLSTASCGIILTFEARDNAPTIFAVKKVFGDENHIEEYVNDGSTDDIVAYCFQPDGSACESVSGIAAPMDSFESLSLNKQLTINFKEQRNGYPLSQVRIIPLNLTLGVSHTPTGDCGNNKFTYMKVNAAVNCYGSFREKQIMVPGADSLGYSSLFDYTIYNIGTLRPNN